jgi:hypothetical protein
MASILWQTEGENSEGQEYESSGCTELLDADTKQFYHELLDEFLESFAKNPQLSKISFCLCTEHPDSESTKG